MKNLLYILFITVILFACEDKDDPAASGTSKGILASHGWQLEKYTNLQGETLTDNRLNNKAKLLYDLAYEFRSNGEVLGIDKKSRNIVNRGTWSIQNQKTLMIDIVAFEGDFEIVRISKGTMILKANTENQLFGVGPEVQLVFSKYDL